MRWSSAVAVVAILLVWSARGDANTVAGNFWLEPCEQERDLCIGYVHALIEMNSGLVAMYKTPMFCMPGDVTVAQAMKVIVKSMREAPEKLHLPFGMLSVAALQSGFPCEPESQTLWQALAPK